MQLIGTFSVDLCGHDYKFVSNIKQNRTGSTLYKTPNFGDSRSPLHGFLTNEKRVRMRKRKFWRAKTFPFFLAAAATALGFFVQQRIDESLGSRHPFAILYFAVALSSWIGGLAAGLTATVFSLLFGSYFLMAKINGLPQEIFDARLSVLFFALNSLLTSGLFGLIHRTLRILRKAQAQVVESDERFRQVAENIRDQIFYVASPLRDRMLYISPSFEKIWGIRKQDQVEQPLTFLKQVHEADQPKILAAFEAQLQGEQTTTEFRFFHPNGQLRWILDRAFPVKDESGRVVRIAGIAEDVTIQKQLEISREAELRVVAQSEGKYRFLFRANPQPMWIVDRETLGFLEVNEAALREFGYSKQEYLQKKLSDLAEHLSGVEKLPDLPASGRIEGYRKIRCKDGREVQVEVNASDIVYEGRAARLASLTNVTELLKARRLADEASQAKSRFLANMSHEIRTPLGAILGFTELMANPQQSAAEKQDCISTILRNGVQLSRVINDILDLSKIESDKLEIERIPFSPLQLIEDVVHLLRRQAKLKGLELNLFTDGTISAVICSDPTRIKQILINIIGNAVKFTERGRVDVIVSQVSEGNREGLRIIVKDQGPGISETHREKLFQAFMQADCSTTRLYGGTGLGLTLSRKLARALGGDLRLLDSEVGGGSSFEVTIALGSKFEIERLSHVYENQERLKSENDSDHKSFETLARGRLAGMRILVADDAPDNRVLVSRFVQSFGAEVLCVENGDLAVKEAFRNVYDAILMDIQMPKMDGFEAVGMLRQKYYDGVVIALTAHAMKGDREKCLAAGFNDYVVKPIDKRALFKALLRQATSQRSTSPLPQEAVT